MKARRVVVTIALLLLSHVAAAAVQQAKFAVGTVLLTYDVRGEGKAVLLIPGWTQNLDTWDAQVDALSPHFRVIRFSRGPFELLTDPVDAVALLDHLNVRDAIVVGHSVGAVAALRLALHVPQRVSALVLYGPPSSPGLTLPWTGSDGWPAHLRRHGVTSDLPGIVRNHGLNSLLVLARSHRLFHIPETNSVARSRLDAIWAAYDAQSPCSRRSAAYGKAARALVKPPLIAV